MAGNPQTSVGGQFAQFMSLADEGQICPIARQMLTEYAGDEVRKAQLAHLLCQAVGTMLNDRNRQRQWIAAIAKGEEAQIEFYAHDPTEVDARLFIKTIGHRVDSLVNTFLAQQRGRA